MRKWWWRAARTVLWGRAPHTARQAARRSSGRPRPEMRLTPLNVPDSLSRGARPACLTSAPALVKHAGLAPRDNESGTFKGVSRISGRGRPELRLAAWRAVWGALPHNTVLAARNLSSPLRQLLTLS